MSYPFLPDPTTKEKGTIEFPNNSTEYVFNNERFTFDRLESPMPDNLKSSMHMGTPLTPGILGAINSSVFTNTTINSKFLSENKEFGEKNEEKDITKN